MLRLVRTAVFAPVAALLLACGGSGASGAPTSPPGGTTTPTPPSSMTVSVDNNYFGPSSLAVSAGQTVTWTWNACTSNPYGYGNGTCVSHGIVFDDGTKSSIQSEGSFARTFAAKGIYAYHCQVHGTAMSGTIVVQ